MGVAWIPVAGAPAVGAPAMNAPTMAVAPVAAAGAGVAASTATAARLDEDLCPLCDKHCPLSAPSCRKGRAYAASHAAGEHS